MKLPHVHRSAVVAFLLLSLSLPTRGADDCSEWKRSYAAYEDEIYEAIRDEPEDLLKELRRHAKAVAGGQTEQADKIERKIRGGLTGLQAIVPHTDMAQFHENLVACYENGVAVLDAEERGDGPGRCAAELRSWQALRNLFVTMRDLLASYGCDADEVDTIDRKALPHIDAEIEALRAP